MQEPMLPLPVRMVYLHQNLSCKEFDTIRSTVLFSYEKLPCRYIFPTYIGYFYPTQGTEDGIRHSPFPIQLSVMEVMQKKVPYFSNWDRTGTFSEKPDGADSCDK